LSSSVFGGLKPPDFHEMIAVHRAINGSHCCLRESNR
jgi:hypothetical protein